MSKKRIEVDTSQLEGQYNFRGVESEVRKVNKLMKIQTMTTIGK